MPHTFEARISEAAQWAAEHRDASDLRRVLSERGCYIYGAGGYGREVAAALQGRGYAVHGFVDTFTGGGQLVAGLPSFLPDEVQATAASQSVLVIGVNNFKTPVDEIVAWARSLPFADVVFVAELPDVVDQCLGHYWQASRQFMVEHSDQLARLHDLLSDDRSREILTSLVRFRITGRPEDHPAVDRERQYFPQDLPLQAKSAISLVDCGAFPGDMLDAVAGAGLKLSNWYAFEPDARNFDYLCKVAAGREFASASLFPCGVGDSNGVVRFSDGAADASRAMNDGEGGSGVTVPIVRVGDVVQADSIDMVKLDVEGFEAQAIDGMVELLGAHRPRLAMAIYHKPADLWELAFKVDALFPGGRYAIRQHGYNGYDTVLYVDW